MYFEPWMWYDGNQHGGFNYFGWEGLITSRMALPAPVTIVMWGEYTSGTGQGTVNVYLQNDSTAAINGRVIIVITEDSLFYMAPNGVNWHNHVPRKYLPDHNGTVVSIPASSYEIVSQAFTIDPLWNDNYCKLLAWIQNDSMQVDSTKEIWQGAIKKVTELGIEETDIITESSLLRVSPNPCWGNVTFSFDLPQGVGFRITIYDVLGRRIRDIKGVASSQNTVINWDMHDTKGSQVNSGIYLYEFISPEGRISGKIIAK